MATIGRPVIDSPNSANYWFDKYTDLVTLLLFVYSVKYTAKSTADEPVVNQIVESTMYGSLNHQFLLINDLHVFAYVLAKQRLRNTLGHVV